MGDLPAALAVQSGLPVKAVAAMLPIGASEFLLAKPGITSISQLKGQTVAYTTGTAEQAFALRALATAGLSQHDVTQVNVALDQLGTALESGIGGRVGRERRAEGRVPTDQPDGPSARHPTDSEARKLRLHAGHGERAAQQSETGGHRRLHRAFNQGGELGEDPRGSVQHGLLRQPVPLDDGRGRNSS